MVEKSYTLQLQEWIIEMVQIHYSYVETYFQDDHHDGHLGFHTSNISHMLDIVITLMSQHNLQPKLTIYQVSLS